ncbi:MAG TPA: HEPN domain-containing protein [Anaerolineae bacterium]|nr:HEPN domain-containing protein [Anaerolineae bacterium]
MKQKGKARAARVLAEERVPYLTDRERESLARFLEQLEAECGDRVQRVVLFGSRARGDHDAESDVDLLVVTAEEQDKAVVDSLTPKDDVVFFTLSMSEAKYRRYQRLQLPLYVNLRRDGIELWDPQQAEIEQREIPLHFPEGERRTMDEATKETITFYLEQAHHNLRGAHVLQEDDFLDIALSRAYYACFHALTAALYAVNVVRGKHSGVQAALSEFLVRPGLVEPQYKDIYNALKDKRESSDYDPRFVADPDEARKLLAEAERFVARMEAFLREQGFEP